MNTLNKYAPTFLRIGLALVVIWFGISQLSNAKEWLGFLPDWTASLPISQTALVLVNGWFEVVFGLMLFFGFYTRLTALLIGLHLAEITYSVGYGAIGVRDFGLAIGALSLFMSGPSPLSADYYFAEEPTLPRL